MNKLRSIEQGGAPPEEKEEEGLDELLERYGFSHLKGRPIEDILEELILLPPDERPEELIEELDRIVAGGEKSSTEEKAEEKAP